MEGLGKRRNQANKSRSRTSPRVKANAELCTKTARHSCMLFSLKNDLLLHAALHLFPHQLQSASFNKSIPYFKGLILPVPQRSLLPLRVAAQELAPNFHSRQRQRLSRLEWKSDRRPGSRNRQGTVRPRAKRRQNPAATDLPPLRRSPRRPVRPPADAAPRLTCTPGRDAVPA